LGGTPGDERGKTGRKGRCRAPVAIPAMRAGGRGAAASALPPRRTGR